MRTYRLVMIILGSLFTRIVVSQETTSLQIPAVLAHPGLHYDIGLGVEGKTLLPTRHVLEGAEVVSTEGTNSSSSQQGISYSYIRDRRELERMYGINTSAKARYGVIKGSLTAAASDSVRFDENTVNLCMMMEKDCGSFRMPKPRLIPEAAALISKPKEFRSRFGTHVIVGGTKKAKLFAIFSISNNSTQHTHRLQLDAQAKFGSGVFSGTAKADLISLLKANSSSCRIEYKKFAIGASNFTGSGFFAPSKPADALVGEIVDQMNLTASSLSAITAEFGEWSFMSAASYGVKLPAQLSSPLEGRILEYLDHLAAADRKRDLITEIQLKRDSYDYISDFTLSELNTRAKTLDDYRDKLKTKLQAVMDRGESHLRPPPLEPSVAIPKPQIVISRSFEYPGEQGEKRLIIGYVEGGSFDAIQIRDSSGAIQGSPATLNLEQLKNTLVLYSTPPKPGVPGTGEERELLREGNRLALTALNEGRLFHTDVAQDGVQYFWCGYPSSKKDEFVLTVMNKLNETVTALPVSEIGEP